MEKSVGVRKGRLQMELLGGNTMLLMQRSMGFLWTKQSCILDNIANVETPGYKVKYVTFEEVLDQAVRAAAGGTGSVQQMREAIERTPAVVHEAQESTRMDDNGVNVTEQSVELARNGYQLQYVMQAIASDVATLQAVIRG